MKRIVLILAVILGNAAWADDPATMVITGQGRIAAEPDMAVITLGVVSHDEHAAEALADNSRQLSQVFEVLAAAGIESNDIQTTQFSIQPIWRNRSYDSSDPAEIESYSVENNVTVRVREIEALGDILDAVARAGANEFRGIQFTLQEPGPAEDAARQAAVADAQARADLIAGAAGVQILGILSITESGGMHNPGPEMMAVASRSVPVAGGEVGVSASITITYEIGNQ